MKTRLVLLLLIFIAVDAFGQRRVLGLVLDERNEPVLGATIQEAGSRYGVITNLDGEFTFTTARDSAVLRISFIGYYLETIEITSDSIITIRLTPTNELLSDHPIIPRLQRIVGVDYDMANSMVGVSLDILRHLWLPPRSFHFTYEVSAQTNFKNDYGFGGSIGLKYPIWRMRWLNMLSLNYRHKNFSENANLNFHKTSIKGSTFLRPIRTNLFVEPAFQSLNGNNNFGLNTGIGRRVWRRGHLDLSTGYFIDYWTYSISVQHQFNWRFRVQASYEKIDRFDFFNIGVRYTIPQRWR